MSGDARFLSALRATSLGVVTIALTWPTIASAQVDELLVTAQKREENLLDVPIAVSSFDDHALARRQIDEFTDLQINIPNVSFTKDNFTTSSFSIRGIGKTLIGATADSGVEVHYNFIPIVQPRLFEIEFYDVERVEVLRGPQGTLYGRNATGGTFNLITKKPQFDGYQGGFEVEGGNYEAHKFKAFLNLPIGDKAAARFAATYHRREGFTENLFTGNDIDDRNQWSARASFRLQPTDNTDITIVASRFEEDSNRARITKQMCHRDPAGNLGCLPDRLAFEPLNSRGTLFGRVGELGPLLVDGADGSVDGVVTVVVPGLGPVGFPPPNALVLPGTDVNFGATVPTDLRQVYADFDPTYQADESFVTLEISHDFGDLTLVSNTGYQNTSIAAETDLDWTVAAVPFNGPAVTAAVWPGGPVPAYAASLNALFGGVPLSAIDEPTLLGVTGGSIRTVSDRAITYDLSRANSHQWSQELRVVSDYEGPFNFLIGGFFLDYTNDTDYFVVDNQLDYFALISGRVPPFFDNEADIYELRSYAAFGELYYDVLDNLTFTGGLRWTHDRKHIRQRSILFEGFTDTCPNGAVQPFCSDTVTFDELTGRAGFNWKPDLAFTDDTMVYAFYSRGYKAGGFNPPFDGTLFPSTPTSFQPEFVNAYEVGAKNLLFSGSLQANLNGFFYDYNGLQVSRIQNRTSFNDNIDAAIAGFEGEFIATPFEGLVLNANVSYLNTKAKNTSLIDPRDPAGGNAAFTTVKDLSTGANCVVPTAAIPAAVGAGAILPLALGGPFGSCTVLQNPLLPFGGRDGIPVDLDGNELQNAPNWTMSFGAQYTYPLRGGHELTGRIDYYWQSDFWGRVFNRDPIDRIRSWDQMNLQVELSAPERSWYLRGFVKNVMDDDNITGMFVADASTGLFTNLFLSEPRTWGVVAGIRF